MRRRWLGVFCSALACVAGLSVRVASAQTAADLFDAGTVQDLRFFVNSKDLALLRENFNDNTKYPADMLWRNIRVRNVSIRSRGTGSRNPNKLGLQVSFDHYTQGQRFLGLSALVLKNVWQDPAMLRERIAMAFYNRMGVAASREGWARVYVNNEYWGLYGTVEDIDADFLTRAFGETPTNAARGEKGTSASGYLFEYHWQELYWRGEYLGDGLDAYKPFFGPVTHDLDADVVLYTPFRDLFREVNAADDGQWRSRVEQYISLKEFVIYVAIEVYLSEWDGMTGNWGMNNFFIYRPHDSLLHHLIPWDRDHSMLQMTGDMSIFQRVDENVIFHRAMAFDELRALYLETLRQCAVSAQTDDWFQNELARTAALIAAPAHEDTKKQFTNAEFDAEIQSLMVFTQVRPGFVLQQVANAVSGAQRLRIGR